MLLSPALKFEVAAPHARKDKKETMLLNEAETTIATSTTRLHHTIYVRHPHYIATQERGSTQHIRRRRTRLVPYPQVRILMIALAARSTTRHHPHEYMHGDMCAMNYAVHHATNPGAYVLSLSSIKVLI
jgi:hypothetical protein